MNETIVIYLKKRSAYNLVESMDCERFVVLLSYSYFLGEEIDIEWLVDSFNRFIQSLNSETDLRFIIFRLVRVQFDRFDNIVAVKYSNSIISIDGLLKISENICKLNETITTMHTMNRSISEWV